MKLLLLNLVLLQCLFSSSTAITTNIGEVDEMMKLAACNYSAIYNFGDSNSDTGGIAAAFYPPMPPSGDTYFQRPAGRASDGRLIIDFISDEIGISYLNPYLDSIGSSFKHGANFATGGATIQPPNEPWFANGISPFSLQIQVQHFIQFIDRASHFYHHGKDECIKERLPNLDEDYISKALFTMDIGQNDIALGIRTLSYQLQQAALPQLVSQLISQVRSLYERGARTFWIHNTGPIGCLPVATRKVGVAGYLDEIGCVKSQNEIAMQFNKQLKDELVKLRSRVELHDAALVYVDMYKAKYELISQARNQGFKEAFGICCGYHGIGYDVWCGHRGTVNGSEVVADSCQNVSSVISWDGVHCTEAANHWIANRIFTGSFSDPITAAATACHSKPYLN